MSSGAGESIERTIAYPLWAFLFDIPYLGACGIFPPLHVLNELLSSGGGDGGMSPGASWTPFEISGSDYAALIPRVLNPERSRLAALARYHDQEWSLDPELDHHTDYVAWRQAACEKHRSAYDAKRKRR